MSRGVPGAAEHGDGGEYVADVNDGVEALCGRRRSVQLPVDYVSFHATTIPRSNSIRTEWSWQLALVMLRRRLSAVFL